MNGTTDELERIRLTKIEQLSDHKYFRNCLSFNGSMTSYNYSDKT